ncbi:MAG: DUF1559 family PulG-like putative transporter [Gemmataceae bacterium]
MATISSTRWRGGGVAAVLLLALLLTTENARPARDENKTAALPSDLAKIPSDGMLACSIRVAELWSGDVLKSVRGKHKEIDQAAQDFEKLFGLSLEQVERLTLTIIGPPPVSREPVMIVRTVKPYELAKVLDANTKLKPEKYKGETLYVSREWAVYPLDDRTLAYSEVAAELRTLIDRPRPKEKGNLADALQRAAEKHALVLGINVKQYYDSSEGKPLPPDAEPFRPLFAARWVTLVADIGAESRLAATLHFGNDKDAKAAIKTAQSGLDLARAGVDQGIMILGKEKDNAALVSMLKQLQAPLKDARIEREDVTLQTSVRARVDLTAMGAVLVQAQQRIREKNARIESANNLHNIGIAMQNYADTTGRFPTQATYDKNGKPMLSWRVLILPYIEQQNLYNQFHLNEPWDSEHNKKLLAKMPKTYASPRDEKTVKEHTTHYQGFVGNGAFFEGKKGLRFPADLPDGTSLTIMIVEASKAVPWSKPEDLPFDPAKPLPQLGLPGASGFMAVMCDASIRTFSHKITKETLRGAITRDGGEVLGPDF